MSKQVIEAGQTWLFSNPPATIDILAPHHYKVGEWVCSDGTKVGTLTEKHVLEHGELLNLMHCNWDNPHERSSACYHPCGETKGRTADYDENVTCHKCIAILEKRKAAKKQQSEQPGLEMKYFVLKPRGTSRYAEASRIAMTVYADHIAAENEELAKQLRSWSRKESVAAKEE
jgi:hypothetical protein